MQTIQLQSIGRLPAIKAENLKINDVLAWNFGETSTVIEILKETKKSIWIKEKSNRSGQTYERRFLKTRLVAKVN